ncbi:MAG: phosphatidate cytidylyltransferase [Myxococcales bacterium]|nr:phosphatidate cytidylyltransferase [Myxococcales bacterium]
MAASNLTLRFLTAVVAVPPLLGLLFFGPDWAWLIFLTVAGAVPSALEIFGMAFPGDRRAKLVGVAFTCAVVLSIYAWPSSPRVLVTTLLVLPFASIVFALWRLRDIQASAVQLALTTFGPLWIGTGVGSVALIRVVGGTDGPAYALVSLVLAWLGDTGGYFAGRFFGKHKLFERVSPKKTVEGAIGGMVAVVLGVLGLRAWLLPSMPVRDAVVLAVLGSVLGTLGDLGESLLKRSVGVKDSGGIVPGHGGMLDRIDAVLLTGPLTLLYLVWNR